MNLFIIQWREWKERIGAQGKRRWQRWQHCTDRRALRVRLQTVCYSERAIDIYLVAAIEQPCSSQPGDGHTFSDLLRLNWPHFPPIAAWWKTKENKRNLLNGCLADLWLHNTQISGNYSSEPFVIATAKFMIGARFFHFCEFSGKTKGRFAACFGC